MRTPQDAGRRALDRSLDRALLEGDARAELIAEFTNGAIRAPSEWAELAARIPELALDDHAAARAIVGPHLAEHEQNVARNAAAAKAHEERLARARAQIENLFGAPIASLAPIKFYDTVFDALWKNAAASEFSDPAAVEALAERPPGSADWGRVCATLGLPDGRLAAINKLRAARAQAERQGAGGDVIGWFDTLCGIALGRAIDSVNLHHAVGLIKPFVEQPRAQQSTPEPASVTAPPAESAITSIPMRSPDRPGAPSRRCSKHPVGRKDDLKHGCTHR